MKARLTENAESVDKNKKILALIFLMAFPGMMNKAGQVMKINMTYKGGSYERHNQDKDS